MNPISFTVIGKPATSGSKRGFAIKKGGQYTGKVVMIGDCAREKDWKAVVSMYAAAAMKQAGNDGPTDEPVSLEVQFLMERPRSHFNTKGDVKKASPLYPQSKPDLTKLLRCLEDALHGIVWKNDSQVCNQAQIKRYTGKGAQAIVTITPLAKEV